MRPNVSWVLKRASEIKSREDKVKFLRENETEVLKNILKYSFDKSYKWLLPKGKMPFKPCLNRNQHGMFYNRARELYLYLEGGNANLSQEKREKKFIDLLEEIDPEDARMLIWAKDNRDKDRINPYPSLSRNIVREAFPGILPDDE